MNTNTTSTLYEVHLDEKNGVTKATIRPVIIPEDVEITPTQENCTYWHTRQEAEEWAKQYELEHDDGLRALLERLGNNNVFWKDAISARTASGITPADQVAQVLDVLQRIVNASTAELWAVKAHYDLLTWHKSLSAGQPVKMGKKTVDALDRLNMIFCDLTNDWNCRSGIAEVNMLRYWCYLELTLVRYRLHDGTDYNGSTGGSDND